MIANVKQNVAKAAANLQWQRKEAKYIVPESIVPDLRKFIKPFVSPDPNGKGVIPEYTVTTLQLDSPTLMLHRAKADEALNRFKLRVRTYGDKPGDCPFIFMEIKRKLDSTVVKSRCKVPWQQWSGELLSNSRHRQPIKLDFKNTIETDAFFEFVRLTHAIGAIPKVLIRYERESYFGNQEDYARVTIDRNIRYCPTRGYGLFPENQSRPASWWGIDPAYSTKRKFPGLVLELKTYSNEVPNWMLDCVQRFDLVQTGFCKYSSAMDMEAQFVGGTGLGDTEENPWY